jgi:3-oxoacyl-[acyl-carrier protein] reductase
LTADGWVCVRTTSSAAPDPGWLHLDLGKTGSVVRSLADLPPLDAVVVAAGMEPQKSLEEATPDHLYTMFDVHVLGPMLALKAARPALRSGAGTVLISSVAAYRGSYDPAYAAAKGAVVSLTRSLARAWAPDVRVNALAPSLVEGTPVYEGMTEDFRENHRESTPLDLATPGEVADAVRFLVGHQRLTGVVMHMNGGQYFG